MKQYIGISRDHSGSMASLTNTAIKDYNSNIDSIREGGTTYGIDTLVNVVKCGSSITDPFEVLNSSVAAVKPLTHYDSNGGMTPLFDSIGLLIDQLLKVPDADRPEVSFLVMAITDGQENASTKYNGSSLSKKIKELQATDRWTFVFRVPVGYAHNLIRLGIPQGNILEWETTNKGFERATATTQEAVRRYYSARASGQRSTSHFYSDLTSVKPSDIKRELNDITKEVTFWKVTSTSVIRDFVETKLNKSMLLGTAFYELTKPEKVQSRKKICIRNKNTGKVYEGSSARTLLGLPSGGEIKLHPGDHGDFDVFIQSTSVNRKLLPKTEVLYWPKA